MAFTAVLAIVHSSHEDTSTALVNISTSCFTLQKNQEIHRIGRTLSPQALNLAVSVYLVIFEDGQLCLLSLVLYLFGSSVHLLLALLGTSTQT